MYDKYDPRFTTPRRLDFSVDRHMVRVEVRREGALVATITEGDNGALRIISGWIKGEPIELSPDPLRVLELPLRRAP